MTDRDTLSLLLAALALVGMACILVGMWLPDATHLPAVGCAIVFGTICLTVYVLDRSAAVDRPYGRAV